jgi:hypothetical protein
LVNIVGQYLASEGVHGAVAGKPGHTDAPRDVLVYFARPHHKFHAAFAPGLLEIAR